MSEYENNLDCKWTLWGPKGYGIRVDFPLISLEDTGKMKFQIESSGLWSDWLSRWVSPLIDYNCSI